jgi:competence protein ComEA
MSHGPGAAPDGEPLPRPRAWWQRPITAGPAGALLTSRIFVPVSLALTMVLLAGTSLEVAMRLGWTPPSPWRAAPHTIVITGPGVGQTSTALTVYILGAVRSPGVYTLPTGARVSDLVQAAGGLLPDADPTRVDLAAHVADGQEVYVPHVGEAVPADLGGLVNINSATADDLHNALGISLVIARRIVAYRTAHGPFTAVSQLLLVPISRTTYDRIKYLVTI